MTATAMTSTNNNNHGHCEASIISDMLIYQTISVFMT